MKWRAWVELGEGSSKLTFHGIYKIRIADASGRPIPIGRTCGTDAEGILYVGRSGFASQRTARTVARRLREFQKERHSGGQTYSQAKRVYDRSKRLRGHRMFASAVALPDSKIEQAERKALRGYFEEFGELPPLNSAFPGKHQRSIKE